MLDTGFWMLDGSIEHPESLHRISSNFRHIQKLLQKNEDLTLNRIVLLKIVKNIGKATAFDRDAYWQYQRAIGHYYWETILAPLVRGTRVLDIGCGEGGVLSYFAENGFLCFGLDNNITRVEYAQSRITSNIQFIHSDFEKFNCDKKFDLILILDVIEHIKDKQQALLNIKNCLSENGILLLTFPPYRSPYGGHQQILNSFLKYIPYWHVLPRKAYCRLLETFEKKFIDARLEIYDRGITIQQFEKLIREMDLICLKRINYFVRPRQSLRFGTKVIHNRVPILREWLTTGVTYALTNRVEGTSDT